MGTQKYISSDYDPWFTYHKWTANLSNLDTDKLKSKPCGFRLQPFSE